MKYKDDAGCIIEVLTRKSQNSISVEVLEPHCDGGYISNEVLIPNEDARKFAKFILDNTPATRLIEIPEDLIDAVEALKKEFTQNNLDL